MATKKKRLTQRERAERAAAKKRLQARGVLPPDKPRLNRKKFAQETWAEWTALTPEQVGILKAMKIAVEYEKFLQKLEAEDRSDYSIGELADEVILPVWKL